MTKDKGDANAIVLERAVASDKLTRRAEGNRQFGTKDFTGWVRRLIESVPGGRILDFCCGTGNQLVLYAERSDTTALCGVDASAESLARAKERLSDEECPVEPELIECRMEQMFEQPQLIDREFDAASCYYGLYYADNPEAVLRQVFDHLRPGGTVTVVGPHGRNNASFFDLLSRYFELPEPVIRSATTFMDQEVLPVASEFGPIRSEAFVNPVKYSDADSVMDYWRSSTFYEDQHVERVYRDLQVHFERHGEFVMEKHIKAIVATKK